MKRNKAKIFIASLLILSMMHNPNISYSYAQAPILSEYEQSIYSKIKSLEYPYADRVDGIHFEQEHVSINEGSSMKLQLLDKHNSPITEGVKWYMVTTYPYSTIYEGGQDVKGSSVKLSSDGEIRVDEIVKYSEDSHQKSLDADIWAVYNNHYNS